MVGTTTTDRAGRSASREPLVAARHPVRRRRVARRRRKNGRWQFWAAAVMTALTAFTVYDVSRESVEAAGTQSPATPATPATQHGVAEHPSPAPNPEGDSRYPESMSTAELPVGGPFTERGAGRWSIMPGDTERVGLDVPVLTYSVEVEEGVELLGGPQGFVTTVRSVLSHPKGWIGSGEHAFQGVSDGDADLRVSLTSQMTTRKLCGSSSRTTGRAGVAICDG